ncbi:MAG: ATP-grasp domain-containing protein [Planctomycetaceae bacterium]|nr:ATP-grasp domain-containing protein [Planctomycetaceae bacterium]
MLNDCVLVAGTTTDYVDIIRQQLGDRAIFLTNFAHRAAATEPAPPPGQELLADLSLPHEQLLALVTAHAARFKHNIVGVACFDDESMALASSLAKAMNLPYPSAAAVAACRSKLACKQAWSAAGLPTPAARLVRTAADAADFMHAVAGAAVLKPLTGSGSELIFFCRSAAEAADALATITARLATHHDARMYGAGAAGGAMVDSRSVAVIEEFVQGPEYSCDFVIEGGRARIIRLARKIMDHSQTLGTCTAYIVPAPPPDLSLDAFTGQLAAACRAVGIERSICMLDFIVRDGRAVMIEIAPRPGGDCLPPLLKACCGMDMLASAVNFAAGEPVLVPPSTAWKQMVGLRLFAKRSGVIQRLDASAISADPRVSEVYLRRAPGHEVRLPPADYDSRLLGHVIFDPSVSGGMATRQAGRHDVPSIEQQCTELSGRFIVEYGGGISR